MKLTNGAGVDSAIEALGSEQTIQECNQVTKPRRRHYFQCGYHGKGDYVGIRGWIGASGMAEKSIRTGLCPGGRCAGTADSAAAAGRVDPARMTTHTFEFRELDKAFEIMDKKLDGVMKR